MSYAGLKSRQITPQYGQRLSKRQRSIAIIINKKSGVSAPDFFRLHHQLDGNKVVFNCWINISIVIDAFNTKTK
ncbi:hypothetical protein ViNHUV68_10320 [Vibrio sp. NH-UV-68]